MKRVGKLSELTGHRYSLEPRLPQGDSIDPSKDISIKEVYRLDKIISE